MSVHRDRRPRVLLVAATILLAATFALPNPATADVRLPSVIGSNMVLQRDAELPIWGWAEPGEVVVVAFSGQQAKATAGDDGRWSVRLKPVKAGGPHELVVEGTNRIALENILVGEVWVCSGQSNMQWSVRQSANPDEEIAAARFPGIRLFHVPRRFTTEPEDDVDAQWTECNPEKVEGFSAVAYYFGRKLHQELDVPVGLIHTSWGGTRIEPWTPPAGLMLNRETVQILQRTIEAVDRWKQAKAAAEATGQESPKHPLEHNQAPTALYNGMVHALVPFAIRGALWYQGESNRGEGMLYFQKMQALVGGWRKTWDQGEFPFLFVQLAPWRYPGDNPEALPEIWEAQLAALRGIPNTGMAVTTDIGNLADIHPKNKQDVGLRLALWALAKTYGHEDVEYSGPLYKSMAVEDGKARVQFEHAAGLKSRDGQSLSWFKVAGSDGKFVDAQATIEGETVVVWSDEVEEPKAVRFGWHQEAEPNLVNGAGLPASPFRTDAPRAPGDT
ncbi:MAG TPA: sialate O-acetylesterase [Planctomycetaceae bacterium]|nr:sialate O-acetylesterase [Planctomycetaceae bacterium]